DEVVAVAAQQPVVAVAAQDRVVAGAAVHGDLDQGGQVPGGREAVVAAVHVDNEVLAGADVNAEGAGVKAVEAHPGTVGRGGEGLGAVAAVDLHGVVAGAALVEVGVVAGVPDHAVVAGLAEDLVVRVAAGQGVVVGAAEQHVVAALAQQGVVAALAEEQVIARAAGQGVVAGAAEEEGGRQRAAALVQGQLVVAGLA